MAPTSLNERPKDCECGVPYDEHYTNPIIRKFVDKQIAEHGWTVAVTVEGPDPHTYYVPRHYIAVHGVKAAEVPELAEKYGWEVL